MPRSDRGGRLAVAAGMLALASAAQGALGEFRAVLERLDAPSRSQLERRAALWTGWTPAERNAHRARLRAFDALPLAERARRRSQYAAWRQLNAADRQRVRQAADAFARLPQARRVVLQLEFDQLDASTHHGYLLGPDLGRDYPRLQPLLAQVPEAEHGQLLRVLRQMTPAQRDALATLVQRTPPQDRATLRRELAATTLSNRDAWLWMRLDR